MRPLHVDTLRARMSREPSGREGFGVGGAGFGGRFVRYLGHKSRRPGRGVGTSGRAYRSAPKESDRLMAILPPPTSGAKPIPYYQDDLVTLYHGDCRPALRAMPDRSVDAVITDPPFSDKTHESTRTNNTANGRRGNRVLSGSFGFDSITPDELRTVLADLGRISKGWVVASIDYKHAFEFETAPPPGLRLLRIGAWVKTNPNPQISGDRPAQGWEAIAYFHRDDLRPSWNGGGRAGNFVLPSSQGQGHPTSKPLPMVAQLVRWVTNPGDLVLDPYAGSGTTARACKDEGRRCLTWEALEPFCRLTTKRLTQDTLFGGVA